MHIHFRMTGRRTEQSGSKATGIKQTAVSVEPEPNPIIEQLELAESCSNRKNATIDLFQAIRGKDLGAFRDALARHANPNAVDKSNAFRPPVLNLAAERGNVAMIEELVQSGAILDARDKNDWTALACAVEKGELNATKTLLELGANPNLPARGGWTPLMLASMAHGDRQDLAELLLNANAAPYETDANGHTALYWAAINNRMNITQTLLSRRPEPADVENAFQHCVTENGYTDVAKLLDKHRPSHGEHAPWYQKIAHRFSGKPAVPVD